MSFSILTNVASLQAQNYLNINENYQNQTINEVTSGLRIVNSGDDAAGLAVANGMAADGAVLTQGIQNASQGLNQLQIADGGMTNISQLLNRAETLATESASGTFTGDRGTLDSEFQSVLGEIDRQAQSIGLNQGGTFAQNLSVFIGGGKGTTAADVINNGSVSVNLSTATVDTKSLGLKGVQAAGTAGTDIGTGSKYTSVQAILNNSTNTGTEAQQGYTVFNFYGPGFSGIAGTGANPVQVSVNLSGVTDTTTLAAAINNAMANAGNGGTQQATAFKNANITASIVTNSSGQQQLAFTSSTAAFQVQGADQVATALMGQFSDSNSPVGVNPNPVASVTDASNDATGGSYTLRVVSSAFAAGYHDYSVTVTASDTTAEIASDIQTALNGNSNPADIKVTSSAAGNLTFTGQAGQNFEVLANGDTANDMGLGTWLSGSTGIGSASATAAAATTNSKTQDVQISIGGGPTQTLSAVSSGASAAAAVANLNTAFQGNSVLKAAGLEATLNGSGDIVLATTTGVDFRVAVNGANNAFGFGVGTVDNTNYGVKVSAPASNTAVNSAGAYSSVNGGTGSGVSASYSFSDLRLPTDTQTVTINALDSSGVAHPLTVNLTNANANSVDAAVQTINTALQQSDDSTLQGMVAVVAPTAGGGQGIQFMNATNQFTISLGATPDTVGLADSNQSNEQGEILTAQVQGTGSTVNISSQATAEAAVTAITSAVTQLGNAQATVGRGENQFNYAINLAQSELTNTQAAESTIRDADLAAESANLTKAQILIQAGVAALAQANSAPQQILSLLQHP